MDHRRPEVDGYPRFARKTCRSLRFLRRPAVGGYRALLRAKTGPIAASIAIVARVGHFDRCDESPRWISSPHPCDRSGSTGSGSNRTRNAGIDPRGLGAAFTASGQAELGMENDGRCDL